MSVRAACIGLAAPFLAGFIAAVTPACAEQRWLPFVTQIDTASWLYREPSETSTVFRRAISGETIVVVEKRESWIKILEPDKSFAWLKWLDVVDTSIAGLPDKVKFQFEDPNDSSRDLEIRQYLLDR